MHSKGIRSHTDVLHSDRQMCQAAKAIGNRELQNKFTHDTTSENGISCMTINMFSLMWAATIFIKT